MTSKLTLQALYTVCVLAFFSCDNQKKNEPEKVNSEMGKNEVKKDDSKLIQKTDFNQLIVFWNGAHSTKDVNVFSNLYDNTVSFYGTKQDKKVCIEGKLSFFKKYPDFNQQILGDIQNEEISEMEHKCSFVKRVTFNKQTKDYPAYLIFSKKGDNWKITTEGDLVTDGNLSKMKKSENEKDKVEGDFNGDGKLDYAWLVIPKINTKGMDCVGECVSYIKFSDATIPSIKVENCIDGIPNNLGDLNKDGTDEIGLLPGWFTSCWHSYNVYTLKNKKWIFAVEPISTHCNQWQEGVKPIEIDLNKKGNVIIRYTELSDLGFEVKEKSVPVK